MGFWRAIYYYMDWVYIGKKEQECIDRQKHLKFMMCKQITDGGIKLKPIHGKELFITKVLKKRRKK